MSCCLEILGSSLNIKNTTGMYKHNDFCYLDKEPRTDNWIQASSVSSATHTEESWAGKPGCPILRVLAEGVKSNKCKWFTFFISTAKGAEFCFPSARETCESYFCLKIVVLPRYCREWRTSEERKEVQSFIYRMIATIAAALLHSL